MIFKSRNTEVPRTVYECCIIVSATNGLSINRIHTLHFMHEANSWPIFFVAKPQCQALCLLSNPLSNGVD